MAVLYKLYQDNRDNSKHKGSWYARAKTLDTVTLNEIAQRIQDNTTAKKADALAVLTEMVEVVRDYLQKSYRVKIDG
ncbi:MAG: DNA-binding protein, partial [Prevotella sp.]|nr:DNA-binding protein [Prevotella sp.]